ncbi:MAG TPA: AzlC family ABC transporter permease [Xanthobacteraceae bacterium]
MTANESKVADTPTWSLDGLRLGAFLSLPCLPGMIAFGIAVGATAARKGFGLLDSILMNVLVYGGASQMVAMEVWPQRLTFASLAALALVTATVNARMLLIGASLRPWLGPLPSWQTYPMLHMSTDPGWLIAMRYRAEGGNDAAVFLGGSLLVWAAWIAATTAGYLLGALVADPRRIGLDLVMPIFFASMLIPLWRGRRRAFAWAVAGGVALLTEQLVSGWWFVVTGALAGSLAEGFADE